MSSVTDQEMASLHAEQMHGLASDLELPGGVITTHCVSSVIRPGRRNSRDPLQFVKIQTPDLSKKAVEQIRLAEEEKITKEKIKEVEEEWQSNLLNWKSKRRSGSNTGTNGTASGSSDQQQENSAENDNENSGTRKAKTFTEILSEKAKSGHRIGYNLRRYVATDDEDEEVDEIRIIQQSAPKNPHRNASCGSVCEETSSSTSSSSSPSLRREDHQLNGCLPLVPATGTTCTSIVQTTAGGEERCLINADVSNERMMEDKNVNERRRNSFNNELNHHREIISENATQTAAATSSTLAAVSSDHRSMTVTGSREGMLMTTSATAESKKKQSAKERRGDEEDADCDDYDSDASGKKIQQQEKQKNVWNYLLQQQEDAARRIHADEIEPLDDDDDEEDDVMNDLCESGEQRQEQLIKFRAKLSAFENLSRPEQQIQQQQQQSLLVGGKSSHHREASSSSSASSGVGNSIINIQAKHANRNRSAAVVHQHKEGLLGKMLKKQRSSSSGPTTEQQIQIQEDGMRDNFQVKKQPTTVGTGGDANSGSPLHDKVTGISKSTTLLPDEELSHNFRSCHVSDNNTVNQESQQQQQLLVNRSTLLNQVNRNQSANHALETSHTVQPLMQQQGEQHQYANQFAGLEVSQQSQQMRYFMDEDRSGQQDVLTQEPLYSNHQVYVQQQHQHQMHHLNQVQQQQQQSLLNANNNNNNNNNENISSYQQQHQQQYAAYLPKPYPGSMQPPKKPVHVMPGTVGFGIRTQHPLHTATPSTSSSSSSSTSASNSHATGAKFSIPHADHITVVSSPPPVTTSSCQQNVALAPLYTHRPQLHQRQMELGSDSVLVQTVASAVHLSPPPPPLLLPHSLPVNANHFPIHPPPNNTSNNVSRYNTNHWVIQEAELRRQIPSAINPNHKPSSVMPQTQAQIQPKQLPNGVPIDHSVVRPEQIYENFKSNPMPVMPPQPQHMLPGGNKQSMLSVSGRKKCSSCNDELGRGCAAMVIESLSLYYHINCFRCSVCHIQLGNGTCGTDVRVRNHKLHCNNCYSNDEAGLKFSRV